ncbi:hypothetical protein E2C01_005333 [Portunus trituberculatus]|uniref:Uncharacterized protein n=1 Tax=Portunus trituberculatus TaxID=210409 RepID=A0A5B7CT95_PORTR|nr:hypothetical protein [Portunus trituberculatus]
MCKTRSSQEKHLVTSRPTAGERLKLSVDSSGHRTNVLRRPASQPQFSICSVNSCAYVLISGSKARAARSCDKLKPKT